MATPQSGDHREPLVDAVSECGKHFHQTTPRFVVRVAKGERPLQLVALGKTRRHKQADAVCPAFVVGLADQRHLRQGEDARIAGIIERIGVMEIGQHDVEVQIKHLLPLDIHRSRRVIVQDGSVVVPSEVRAASTDRAGR